MSRLTAELCLRSGGQMYWQEVVYGAPLTVATEENLAPNEQNGSICIWDNFTS